MKFWKLLFVAAFLVWQLNPAIADDSAASIPSSTITPGTALVSVKAPNGMQLGTISSEILSDVRKQMEMKRFPYFDHRPQESAEKLAAILSKAAADAQANADKQDKTSTVDFRNKVLDQLRAFLNERTSRDSDWKWIIVTGQNIEAFWQNKTKKETGVAVPDAKQWGDLAYVYMEFANAATTLAKDLAAQKKLEDELLIKAMVNGGFSPTGSGSGWVTVPDLRRRNRSVCRWLAP